MTKVELIDCIECKLSGVPQDYKDELKVLNRYKWQFAIQFGTILIENKKAAMRQHKWKLEEVLNAILELKYPC